MITWGLISTATAFVVGQNSFFVLRFLLGIAEAGFFPGIIVYLSNWFPKPYRARIFSSFLVAIPLSGLVGSPISGLVLDRMNGVAGLAGWQWMFIIEGLPAIVLGLACFRFLDNRPADAKWLDPSERERLQEILDLEREETKAIRHYSLTEAFSNPGVLLMCAINFTILFGLYGISFFLPQIIKGFGFSNTTTGFLSALPYLAGAGAMLIWARRSDAKAERLGHLAAAMIFAVLGFVITRCTLDMEAPALVGLLIAAAGLFAANPLLWTLPVSVLTGATAAAAVALINSVASLAGIVAPPLLGWTHDLTGSFTVAAEIFIGVLVLGVVFVGLFSRTRLASAVQR